jgi:hypothetical protein
MREEAAELDLKCVLSDPEINDLAKKMAKAQQDLGKAQDEKAEVVAGFSARIKRHHAEVQEYARTVANGYVFRRVECRVIFDSPGPGRKTTVRLDTGEVVETEDMTPSDTQMTMRFYERSESAETVAPEPAPDTAVPPAPSGQCPTCGGIASPGLTCPDCNDKKPNEGRAE